MSAMSRVTKPFRYVAFQLQRCWTIASRPWLIDSTFRKARRVAARRNGSLTKSALLLPTADPGNLGDEAFFDGAVDELRRLGVSNVCVISFRNDKRWEVAGANTAVLSLHHNPAGKEYLKFVELARHFTHFFVWGADILDGSQGLNIVIPRFRLASLAATLGLKSSICSFSLNSAPAPEVIAGFKALHPDVRLLCREEISRQRLAAHLGAGRVGLSADAAFLLEPDHTTPLARSTASWIVEQKAAGRIVMGLNINDMLCYYFPRFTPQLLAERYVAAMLELRKKVPNLAVLHIPHNIHVNPTPHNTDDFALATAFHDALPAEVKEDCHVLPRTVRAPEIRSICSKVDFVFSGRMHLTIAALAVGTPVFGVAYQGKFEGLFQHFELKDMLVNEDQLMDSIVTAGFLERGITRLAELRTQIRERLSAVMDLARANITVN